MAASPAPYRDDGMAARMRYEALVAEKRQAVKSVEPLAGVHGRRVGRIAGGIAGIGGFAAMVVWLVGCWALEKEMRGEATAMLFASWGLALVVYAVASKIGEAWFGRAGIPARSKDVWADIERLSGIEPDRELRAQVDRSEVWSVALPMMAVSLLGPLTLHGVVYGVLCLGSWFHGGSGSEPMFGGFDWWIAFSLALVGHAHLVAAGLCYRYAKKARALKVEEVDEMSERSERRTFWWTVLAAAIPGGLLYLIPPVIALFTGYGISWLMFRIMRRTIIQERYALEGE
jgi:hypothetical protein